MINSGEGSPYRFFKIVLKEGMDMVTIRNAEMSDLEDIVELENRCFSKEDAASKTAFQLRIERISDTFLVAELEGEIIGLINGPVIDHPYITDDLFKEVKENQELYGHLSVLGLAVDPDYQKQGIASKLMAAFETIATLKKRKTITLTCKEQYKTFYEKLGFEIHGLSQSQHGGAVWYNMVKSVEYEISDF